ncbi:hypothetical protein RB594_005171 [Gaeumannomyces avenae]
MACYCANFYGSVNCHNQVSRFGDRCKLCIALKSGASMSDGLLHNEAADQWVKTSRPDDMSTRPRHHDALSLGGAQHKHQLRSDMRYGRKQ